MVPQTPPSPTPTRKTNMPNLNLTARNERRKITANFLNNLASVFVATGFITPIVSFTADLTHPRSGYWTSFLLLWLCLGASFHIAARAVLKGVE